MPHTGPIVLQGARPSCPGCWHTAGPWTIPRQNLVFFGFISGSGRQASPPERSLNAALVFLRPWSCPRFAGKPQTCPHKPGLWPRESPGSSSSHGRGWLQPSDAFLWRSSERRCPLCRWGNWGLEGGTRPLVPRVLSFSFVSPDRTPGTRCTPKRNGTLADGQARRVDLQPHLPFN